MAIGATGREQDSYDIGRAIGREAKAVGILMNFAPVVDVNNNPDNPVINTRSLGEDPRAVARLSAAFVRGSQDAGVIATIKHFPGHGDTDVDSHANLPIVTASVARLDSVELVPFAAGIEAGAGMVMTAHIALPSVQGDSTTPATLAPRVLTGLLRNTLHFTGLAITDAMTMGGIGKGYTTEESSVLAVQAGADVLFKPSSPSRAIDAVVAAVQRGAISRARIDSSVRRVLEVKERSGVAFRQIVALDSLRDVVGAPEHRAIAEDVATRSVTLLRDQATLIPRASGSRLVLVQYMPETELRAGRIMLAGLREGGANVRAFKIGPSTGASALDSIARIAQGSDRLVVATYVRRIEGEGRFAIPAHVANWIDSLAQHERIVAVSLGRSAPVREQSLVARQQRVMRPFRLPGFFSRGDGLQRKARADTAGTSERR